MKEIQFCMFVIYTRYYIKGEINTPTAPFLLPNAYKIYINNFSAAIFSLLPFRNDFNVFIVLIY